jgi:hypothetical protein
MKFPPVKISSMNCGNKNRFGCILTEHRYKEREKEKERCSGSFHLAVAFLVIKDDSISERPG